jgi:hypothetical protein
MADEAGDEKIIAVPISKLTQRYEHVMNYTDLPEITWRQIEHFFAHYKDLESGDEAKQLIMEAIDRHKTKSRSRPRRRLRSMWVIGVAWRIRRRLPLFRKRRGWLRQSSLPAQKTGMSWWVGNSCFSQPEIYCGDHCSASFCATHHRSSRYSAKRQSLGRNDPSQGRRSALFAR